MLVFSGWLLRACRLCLTAFYAFLFLLLLSMQVENLAYKVTRLEATVEESKAQMEKHLQVSLTLRYFGS